MPLPHLHLEDTADDEAIQDIRAARLATRESIDFVLRSIGLLSEYFDQNILTSIIIASIQSANTAHIPLTPGAAEGAPAANVARRPISISALAKSLNLPFETVRRHVAKLVESGWCVRQPNGIVVNEARLATPENGEYLARHIANLRLLRRNLDRIDPAGEV